MSVMPTQTPESPPQKDQERPGTGHLLAEAARDLSELIDRQWEMAKVEVKSEYRRAKRAAEITGVAAGAALVAIFLISMAAAEGLNEVLPLWASYLIIGSIAAIGAFGLFRFAASKAQGANMLPDRTIKTLTEDR